MADHEADSASDSGVSGDWEQLGSPRNGELELHEDGAGSKKGGKSAYILYTFVLETGLELTRFPRLSLVHVYPARLTHCCNQLTLQKTYLTSHVDSTA